MHCSWLQQQFCSYITRATVTHFWFLTTLASFCYWLISFACQLYDLLQLVSQPRDCTNFRASLGLEWIVTTEACLDAGSVAVGKIGTLLALIFYSPCFVLSAVSRSCWLLYWGDTEGITGIDDKVLVLPTLFCHSLILNACSLLKAIRLLAHVQGLPHFKQCGQSCFGVMGQA